MMDMLNYSLIKTIEWSIEGCIILTLKMEIYYVNQKASSDAIIVNDRAFQIGTCFIDYIDASNKDIFRSDFAKALNGEVVPREVCVVRGQSYWYSRQLIPIVDEFSNIVFVLFTVNDITKMKQYEIRIQKQHQHLHAMANCVDAGILYVSSSKRILFFNIYASVIAKQLIDQGLTEGEEISELINLLDCEEHTGFSKSLVGESINFERELTLNDDNRQWFKIRFQPVWDNEIMLGIQIIFSNIQQEKMNEMRLIEKNNQLIEIAQIQSHIIRSPVATILGLINLIKLQKTIDEKLKTIELIEDATFKLDEVIHTIVEKTY